MDTFSKAREKVTAEQEQQHCDPGDVTHTREICTFPLLYCFVVILFACSFSSSVRTHDVI